jgi:hypothetical protein
MRALTAIVALASASVASAEVSLKIADIISLVADDCQSILLAACGPACASGPAPDAAVSRTDYSTTSRSACPSLLISSTKTNSSGPVASLAIPPVPTFIGGADKSTHLSPLPVLCLAVAAIII